MIQGRGGKLEALYFDTPPYTTDGAREKVMELAERLALYQNEFVLHVFNFTEAMQSIRAAVDPKYVVLVSRRMMMRVAERLMLSRGGLSLVTGESLSQVASQTLENMGVVNHVVDELPVLRPLVGMDKLEIIARAEKLGTFEISKRPDQDCCSLFAPKSPITRARRVLVENEEKKVDVEYLCNQTLDALQSSTLTPQFDALAD